jgi:hypothetical protein
MLNHINLHTKFFSIVILIVAYIRAVLSNNFWRINRED